MTSINEESLLAQFLIDSVSGRASGRNQNECVKNYPRDVYFVGNLSPSLVETDLDSGRNGYSQEFLTKLAPSALGAEFLLDASSDNIECNISLCWNCYFRVIPSFNQQKEHRGKQKSDHDGNYALKTAEIESQNGLSTTDQLNEPVNMTLNDRRRTRTTRDSLFIRFKKIKCKAEGKLYIKKCTDGKWIADVLDLKSAIEKEISRARNIVLNDVERLRTTGDQNDKINIPDSVMTTENTFNDFFKTLTSDIEPNWKWEIEIDIRESEFTENNDLLILFQFTNVSPMPRNSPNTEPFLFDVEVTFYFDSSIVNPFKLDLAPKGFRYDNVLWGKGFNCSVSSLGDNHCSFKTNSSPIYTQLKYQTRERPPAEFKKLATNPLPVLEEILVAMQDYCKEWEREKSHYYSTPGWRDQFGAEFELDYKNYTEEICRFECGIQLLKSNDDLLLAFKLTNEAFSLGNKTAWRLFQIVFLVSQIPGISALGDNASAHNSELNKVDIIYFPTGGGKTEAYLATVIFHCFYDRLRGKTAGVTAWTRFPLRLLTLQQMQRVADIIGLSELVRKDQTDPRLSGNNVDGFSVGYFVGEGGSPNEIVDITKIQQPKINEQIIWSEVNDKNVRQKWKRVSRCPSCKTSSVTIDFDTRSCRLIHRCTNPNCKFPNGIIPVLIVDNEIFRYLPSIVVGTIDKLASIGNQRKISLMLGNVSGVCKEHGYYNRRCCQKECTDTKLLNSRAPKGISGPTMFIQDELHLLKEGLGTFDSHYETFLQRLQKELGQTDPLKIIASSATIEAFDRQVEHLYGRNKQDARIFPGKGPTLSNSFYAETLDQPQRLIVGLIPHNKTLFNTILELIEYYHSEVENLLNLNSSQPNLYGGSLVPGTPEYVSLLDNYRTSLTYFLASKDLNSTQTDLEGDVIPNMITNGLQPLSISKLTGSIGTDDVTRILEHLEKPSLKTDQPDAVLATSMVSHGVDVDRLNMMLFYGMPRQNAEYIQSFSRVGRSHIGIVFCCYHPVRERDQSHYSYFLKYHEFLGQLIEPVPINRWSKFSIDRTLPGLFMGILLQIISNRSGQGNPNMYYMLDHVKKEISSNRINENDFIPLLEEAYGVKIGIEPLQIEFRNRIRLHVRQFLDQIICASPNQSFVSEVLIPKPMRSLRDVDEPIEIELDSLGTQWARNRQ